MVRSSAAKIVSHGRRATKAPRAWKVLWTVPLMHEPQRCRTVWLLSEGAWEDFPLYAEILLLSPSLLVSGANIFAAGGCCISLDGILDVGAYRASRGEPRNLVCIDKQKRAHKTQDGCKN